MMKEVGKKISENRKKLKISQIEFAKKLNISNATLSQYESGDINIPLQKIVEISKILDITPNYLLGFEEKGDYKMSNYDLLEKCVNTNYSLRINTLSGADKLKNIIIPLLKNSLNDFIVLDINGKAYEETEKYRRTVLQNKVLKIDLFNNVSESFNPFYYLDYENSEFFIENIVSLYLNEENSCKTKLLTTIIANLFFKNKFEDKNFRLSFPLIYDFINKIGTKQNIIEDLELLSERKSEDEINNNSKYNSFSYKEYFKFYKIMEEKELSKEENASLISKGLIPKYWNLTKELINLGTEKLLILKEELLKDLEIFSNETIRINTIKNTVEMPIWDNIINDFSETMYFIVDEDKIEKLAPLIRIFYYLIVTTRTAKDFLDFPKLKDTRKKYNKLIIIMDNFEKIGRHKILELSSGYIGGYNTNYIIFANINDLKNIYGENNFFLSNTNVLKLSKNKMEYIYKKTSNKYNNVYKSTVFFNNEKNVEEQKEIDDIDKID